MASRDESPFMTYKSVTERYAHVEENEAGWPGAIEETKRIVEIWRELFRPGVNSVDRVPPGNDKNIGRERFQEIFKILKEKRGGANNDEAFAKREVFRSLFRLKGSDERSPTKDVEFGLNYIEHYRK